MREKVYSESERASGAKDTARIILKSISIFLITTITFCSSSQRVEFAKKFHEIEQEFREGYERANERLEIGFREALTFCIVPYGLQDLEMVVNPLANIHRTSSALFVSSELRIPFVISFLLKDVLTFECDETACKITEKKHIKHRIHSDQKKLQENYELRRFVVDSEIGNVELKAYVSQASETLLEINVVWENGYGYSEHATYAVRVTEMDGSRLAMFILRLHDFFCYSVFKINEDGQRVFKILIQKENKYEKFSGILSRNADCPQKPKGNINKSVETEIIGEACDSIFESSNVEALSAKIQNSKERLSDDMWVEQIRNISRKIGIFDNEVRAIVIIRALEELSRSLSFSLIYEKEKIPSLLKKIEEIERELEKMRYAFLPEIEVHLVSDFSVPISESIKKSEKLFLELWLALIKFVLLYVSSLNIEMDDNIKNVSLNFIRSHQRIALKDKAELLVKALKHSPDLLTTTDLLIRDKSFEQFRFCLQKLVEFSESLTLSDEVGSFKSLKDIPQLPRSITEAIDGFIEHRMLSDYIVKIAYILKRLYGYAGKEENYLIYLLDSIGRSWYDNVFSVNFRKLIMSDLRGMLPAMYEDVDHFVMEWECGVEPPTYPYRRFPETLTCGGELRDTEHFFTPERIHTGRGITPNPFYKTGIKRDGLRTSFPYVFFSDPTFNGSLIILRRDLFRGCPEQDRQYDELCVLLELIAFLTQV